MSTEIRVPSLGESIVDATIASWLKKEGDPVRSGETLAELETDKVNVEVSADQDGVLQKILKHEGDTVGIGEVIGLIGEAAQPAAAPPGEVEKPQPAATVSENQRPPSPLARRIAAEHNVDISQIKGSSPHGRVTKEDVIQYLEQNAQQPTAPVTAPPPPPERPTPPRPAAPPLMAPESPYRREERVRMSRRRQTIAQRLVEAQHTAAMLTTFNEVDMSAIMDVRKRRKEAFKEKYNVSLGFMSFFTKAVVGALKAFPRLNAEIQGNEMVIKHYYDIGIAVGAEEGLIVPVVRDADRKSFAEIERDVADLAKRARAGKLTLEELQGGTFTITNGGVFGSLLSTPILNGPQVGILGMHKIEERPVVVDGQIVIRPMMYLALSYDHRIVDGSEAVRFLVKVKELLEDPETLLLEG
uniref:Dihydrolipoyllysine-residue succinyltransferase component of 2-oxoglutarate dehydrogenase complex n=1 Tax=Thermosporothrix sp. COM3 TaxID=2490863 RepID=A0A455SV19_9CHLR|nr:dihydrolipoyllysine-residue succinyltransferase component of 2-oxoglutarate dehydrogenase complex [Thermosporothrix sp. COM3]